MNKGITLGNILSIVSTFLAAGAIWASNVSTIAVNANDIVTLKEEYKSQQSTINKMLDAMTTLQISIAQLKKQ